MKVNGFYLCPTCAFAVVVLAGKGAKAFLHTPNAVQVVCCIRNYSFLLKHSLRLFQIVRTRRDEKSWRV